MKVWGYGGSTLLYRLYIKYMQPQRVGVSAILVINTVSIFAILVINRVWFLHSSLELGMFF